MFLRHEGFLGALGAFMSYEKHGLDDLMVHHLVERFPMGAPYTGGKIHGPPLGDLNEKVSVVRVGKPDLQLPSDFIRSGLIVLTLFNLKTQKSSLVACIGKKNLKIRCLCLCPIYHQNGQNFFRGIPRIIPVVKQSKVQK